MAWSNSILAYPDIQEYLDQALAAPAGLRIDFPGVTDPEELRKTCTTFVFRCNAFRKIVRKEALKRDPADPMHGLIDYDRLKISDRKDHVVIEFWKNLRLKVTELPVEA